ncbi:Pv-fam-h protein, partial [Plasmodium cynomolgi strain B]
MKISYVGANIITAFGGGAQNVTSGDGYGDVEGSAAQCPRKVVKYAAFLKLFMFVLFMLLAQVSYE